MTRTRIIIDTDPGQDDAVAILLALAERDQLDLLGITTVAGNVPLPLTTVNALRILELARSRRRARVCGREPATAARRCGRRNSCAAPTASKAPACRRRAARPGTGMR